MSPCIVFDPEGDITLIIGEERQKFLTSRKILSLASRVFHAMFSSRFAESLKSEVELPDDSVFAALTILRILYYDFDQVLDYMNTQQLYELALFIDKYDYSKVVLPFWRTWTEDVRGVGKVTMPPPQYLFITWTFGLPAEFCYVVRKLVFHIHDNDDLETMTESEGPYCNISRFSSVDTPTNILENMLRVREDVIKKLFGLCADIIANRIDECKCQVKSSSVIEQRNCTAYCLGHLKQGLDAMGYWPLPSPDEITENIETIHLQLSSIKIFAFTEKLRRPIIHFICATSFKSKLDTFLEEVVERMVSPVERRHVEWMQAQARRLTMGSVKELLPVPGDFRTEGLGGLWVSD